MKPVFADTAYYAALMSPKDLLHDVAVGWARSSLRPIIVTEFVLLELGNGFRLIEDRRLFFDFMAEIRVDPNTTIIPSSSGLFHAGLDLYGKRLDKEWSLTDCITFVVMQEKALTEALTGDHHFEQAGFKALLLDRRGAK
jgi:predicted nucleic acid-binding protein